MGNTLGTTNGAIIAQKVLDTLIAQVPILDEVTTNFQDLDGGVTGLYNQNLITHVVSATTAVAYDTTNGYVASDRTQTDVTLTMNKFYHASYKVRDDERASTNLNLIETFSETAGKALAKQVASDVFAVFTPTNYASSVSTVASNAFNRGSVVDVRSNLALAGVNVTDDLYMYLHPTWYGALEKDSSVISVLNFPGTQAAPRGVLPNIAGFDVHQWADLPANSANVVGVAGNKQGVVFASRVVPIPDIPLTNGIIKNITDPNTGLTIQLREFYDMGKGYWQRTFALIYGVVIGNPGNIAIIKSS